MSLPVNIPSKQFNEWDKQISRFVWNGKKPRIKYATLLLSRARGGMALPSLRDYYYAAQIRYVASWCDNTVEAKWKVIERNILDIPIQAMIGDKKITDSILGQLDPITSFTLQVWFSVVKQLGLVEQSRILRWVTYDTAFKPGRMDQRFKYWSDKGITTYYGIIEENNLQSFQYLKDRYNLEKPDFFRYLQLRHYFDQEIKSCIAQMIPNNLILLIAQAYTKGTGRMVSKLYQSITGSRRHTTDYIKVKWEKELNIEITAEQWTNICETQYTTSSSNTWREFCWKNTTRFFITPKLKSRQLRTPQSCWRNCDEEDANHYHVFWGCSQIHGFWKNVLEKIVKILCFPIPLSCSLLYLGDLPDVVTGNDRYLMKIFMAAAKKAITRKWLQTEAPSVEDWLQIIFEIFEMERMTANLRLRKEVFEYRWAKWYEYISENQEGQGMEIPE